MNRRLATIVGVVLLVGLAGCSGLAGTATDPGVGDGSTLERNVQVTASGEATAEPDRATVRVAVTATGEDPQTVRDELSAADESLRTALLDWGLSEDDIRTDRYDVRETRESRQNPDRAEYRGIHQYAIEIDDVDAVGEVIDVAVDAGADEVQRIAFGLSEEREREVREEAIANAMSNADDDAAVLADSSGLELVGAYRVSIGDGRATPYVARAEALDGGDAAAGSAATGIETGDVSVRVTVDVVYEAQRA